LVQKKTIVEIDAPVDATVDSNETHEHNVDDKAPKVEEDNQNEDPKLVDSSVVSMILFIVGDGSQSGSDQENRNAGNNS
jgi:hypothetical protein